MIRNNSRLAAKAVALGFTLLVLGGCTNSGVIQRDGYQVDVSIASSAFNQRIRYVVLHYTDSEESRALRTLQGPHVSAHYLVARAPKANGTPRIRQLVDEEKRAWHAGVSAWGDRTQLNDTSIGIEIVNAGPIETSKGGDWQTYPQDQIDTVITLVSDLIARYDLPPTAILGHSDIAPQRKIDPGPRFPWYRLYRAGIGAWPHRADVEHFRHVLTQSPPTLAQYRRALRHYGYAVSPDSDDTELTRDVTRAFQMHFRPEAVTGTPDIETLAILWALIARYRPEALEAIAPSKTPPNDDSSPVVPLIDASLNHASAQRPGGE